MDVGRRRQALIEGAIGVESIKSRIKPLLMPVYPSHFHTFPPSSSPAIFIHQTSSPTGESTVRPSHLFPPSTEGCKTSTDVCLGKESFK